MTKTLTDEDWELIKRSFIRMNEKFPHAPKSENTPIYRLTSIKGIEEQLQERSVGEVVFYMDYLTSSDVPKIGKCTIIES